MKKSSGNFLSILCLLYLLLVLTSACKKDPLLSEQRSSDVLPSSDLDENISKTDSTPLNQLIVWVKPGISRENFFKWRDSIRNLPNAGPVNISKACGDCDSSLMLLTGKGIETYIKGNTVSGGVGTSGTDSQVSGDTSAVYYCLNYRLNMHPLPPQSLPPDTLGAANISGSPVKVGVLDTGADTFEVKNYPFVPDSPSCIKAAGADFGWNFVSFNSNIYDDEANKHGSTVTRFITDQFGSNGAGKVQILTAKTHNSAGEGDLFTILCAMAYAKQRGVKIINASFGFYLPVLDSTTIPRLNYLSDPNVRLLKKYVYHYLTKNGILLIAAAGNKDSENKKLAFKENFWPYIPNNPQSSNQIPFYPAYLARDPAFPNVVAVTTVFVDNSGNGTVSDQNYSNDVVDIGVIADAIVKTTHYVEKNPKVKGQAIEGSSFVTPIVSGKIAANFNLIQGIVAKKTFSRAELLNALLPIFSFNSNLKSKIKDGRVMRK